MRFIDFHRKKVLVYLFFLRETNHLNNRFYDKVFHFYRINSAQTNTLYKNFVFHDYNVLDAEKEEILRTLLFYGYIDEENNITDIGKEYIYKATIENEWFKEAVERFNSEYNDETAFENSSIRGFETTSINFFYA